MCDVGYYDKTDKSETKCDYCDEPATNNYQKTWVKFKIIDAVDGKYTLIEDFNALRIEEPTGEDNYHLCADHSNMFEDTGYPY
jgi:hypothetical protein